MGRAGDEGVGEAWAAIEGGFYRGMFVVWGEGSFLFSHQDDIMLLAACGVLTFTWMTGSLSYGLNHSQSLVRGHDAITMTPLKRDIRTELVYRPTVHLFSYCSYSSLVISPIRLKPAVTSISVKHQTHTHTHHHHPSTSPVVFIILPFQISCHMSLIHTNPLPSPPFPPHYRQL